MKKSELLQYKNHWKKFLKHLVEVGMDKKLKKECDLLVLKLEKLIDTGEYKTKNKSVKKVLEIMYKTHDKIDEFLLQVKRRLRKDLRAIRLEKSKQANFK